MDRRRFLSTAGVAALGTVCAYCLGGCTPKDNSITGPSNVDFTLDMGTSAYSGLLNAGGWVVNAGVLVANTGSGYIALSATCTHQGAQLTYQAANKQLYCSQHGSTFSTTGAVTRGPASSSLTQYKVTVNGNSLHVVS
jgi:cytochrome b6-f complex iron-sulfur subunit